MKKMICSPYIKTSKRGDEWTAYSSIRDDSLLILNARGVDFLKKCTAPLSFEEMRDILNDSQMEEDKFKEFIDIFLASGLLLDEFEDERKRIADQLAFHRQELQKGKKLRGVVLEISKTCNFRCGYCFAEHLAITSNRQQKEMMDFSVAKTTIDFLVKNARKNNLQSIEVCFMGGEPFLNWKLIEKILIYTSQLALKRSVRISYRITTNGSLISARRARILKQFNVIVSVSLDGPKEINNKIRRYVSGKGTFEKVANGIKTLIEAENEVTILTTLCDDNFDYIDYEFADFLASLGVKNWGLNLEDIKSAMQVNIERIVSKLLSLVKYTTEKDINTGGMWLKPIYGLTNQRKAYCQAAEGAYISVEPNGNIYTCSRTISPIGHVSNLRELFSSPGYLNIGSMIIGSVKKCINCEIEAQCLGGCPAVNIQQERSGGCGLTGQCNVACEFVKTITHRILSDNSLPLIE